MSTYLRKCIDIAPTGVITPGAGPCQRLPQPARSSPWWPALRATTSWLRLWADWPSLQHVAGEPPGTGTLGATSLAALDAQIDAAHADGMKIILLPYRYPRWANGTEGISRRRRRTTTSSSRGTAHARLTQYLDLRAGSPRHDQLEGPRVPACPTDGFGPDSLWAGYVAWLWDRYADRRRRRSRSSTSRTCSSGRSARTIETDDFDARWGTRARTL